MVSILSGGADTPVIPSAASDSAGAHSTDGTTHSASVLNRLVTTTENSAPESPAALTVYSTTWCGYCRRLKTQLDEAGIAYAEIDIEEDPKSAEFVGSVNGGNHVVPTVLYADGSTATNPSLAAVKSALGL
ncbi:glutaredoxin-like protein [Rhodococcus sp. RS1C4]|nr:glutaredoxin-like protein [Rhodococcus sp. RS1C4]OZC62294.1 glutaredoxin-like protein [Rhodococcus sp. 06-621-2]OZC79849.1 glutaredoxin-like protein [Rhodococcus sp. 06-418-1B]OZD67235.1 glutaredoxin-like protein [Rhodococcus sp. 06-1059B-a]OZE88097.1 glutaredoxin-like protein [Rhodococcus sp. 15-649-1-2]OZE97565.1 glutaredoxin-like protein [Rhodococcus sp. 15-1154-1]OZF58231.1 glutaredoxin-like protein [Rhodococcus sp. 14-2470-1a]